MKPLPANNNSVRDSMSLVAGDADAGARLDAFLASKIDGWSRSRLVRLIDDEDVLVNGRPVKPSYRLHGTDEIDVELTELPPVSFEPEDIPLDIIYEDKFLDVINKPAGMVVHPGAGVSRGTLANALAYRLGGAFGVPALAGHDATAKPAKAGTPNASPGVYRVGIVHRLDKDTSGLIVVAKDEQTAEALSKQFHDRQVYKSYVALVHGAPDQNRGTIDRPIARNKHNRLRMQIASHGRSALSLWKVRKRYEKFALVDIEIKTGRTHQIRVHLASINHPVVGDEIYNEGRDNTVADINVRNAIKSMNRFFLHAEKLSFTHPSSGDRMDLIQPLPTELTEFLDLL